jgi:hypothetical protein
MERLSTLRDPSLIAVFGLGPLAVLADTAGRSRLR